MNKKTMYIRFVTNEISKESNQKLGVFHAIRYLRDDGELSDYEFSIASNLMSWFADNLESPLDWLNKQRLKKSDICISWFKDDAKIWISKTRELASILEAKDILVERLITKVPGKIIYEDDIQIFALPYQEF